LEVSSVSTVLCVTRTMPEGPGTPEVGRQKRAVLDLLDPDAVDRQLPAA
jgi:hypothetical protein